MFVNLWWEFYSQLFNARPALSIKWLSMERQKCYLSLYTFLFIYIFILQISLQLWLCKILSRLFQARQHKTTHKGTRQNVLVNVDLVNSQEQLQTNICVKCLGHWCLSINLEASRIGLICPQQNTKYNQEYVQIKYYKYLSILDNLYIYICTSCPRC